MQIRDVALDDLDAVFDLSTRAFGPASAAERARGLPLARAAAEDGRLLGCYDGGRLVGSARYYPMEQWWHGATVPMGGVASVYVTPEERGRGVGSRLAAALIELMAGRGMALSMLYPATAPVYRRAGFEHAGSQHLVTFPTAALRGLAAEPVEIRRAGPEDAAEVMDVLARAHRAALDSGPYERGLDYTRWTLSAPDVFGYLAKDGFLLYRWNAGRDGLIVDRAVAGSARTARSLWSLVGSGSSTAETVQACVAPDDPVLWLLRDRSAERIHRRSWMLRVIDAPAAVAARGFPQRVESETTVAVRDDARPGNAGTWLLSVRDGRGSLTPAGGDAAVRLSERGLAALYAGIPVGTLRRAGLLEGEGDAAAALGVAFAAAPFAVDDF